MSISKTVYNHKDYTMNTLPKKIVVCGQTHGNEWTGRYVVQHLKTLNLKVSFPNIDVKLILANPKAFNINKRYVEQDLNRSFTARKDSTYESQRSIEIEKEINEFSAGEDVFILDLHTTTSNMGSSLVMHSLSQENVSVFSYLKSKKPETEAYAWIEAKELKFLNSISNYGFAIEVGPIAQGTLDAVVYEKTLESVMNTLTFLNSPKSFENSIRDHETIHVFERNVDYPRDSSGYPLAMIAAEFTNKNFTPLSKGDFVFEDFAKKKICLDSAAGLTPLFINEAAYYEKNIAFSLTRKKDFKTLR
jgi:aspartoacylase